MEAMPEVSEPKAEGIQGLDGAVKLTVDLSLRPHAPCAPAIRKLALWTRPEADLLPLTHVNDAGPATLRLLGVEGCKAFSESEGGQRRSTLSSTDSLAMQGSLKHMQQQELKLQERYAAYKRKEQRSLREEHEIEGQLARTPKPRSSNPTPKVSHLTSASDSSGAPQGATVGEGRRQESEGLKKAESLQKVAKGLHGLSSGDNGPRERQEAGVLSGIRAFVSGLEPAPQALQSPPLPADAVADHGAVGAQQDASATAAVDATAAFISGGTWADRAAENAASSERGAQEKATATASAAQQDEIQRALELAGIPSTSLTTPVAPDTQSPPPFTASRTSSPVSSLSAGASGAAPNPASTEQNSDAAAAEQLVIAKALAQEEAKLALVQQRIARGHGTDATDARAPLRPKLLEHSVTHSRRQEPLKQEQQTELKLQLANTRLRAVTRELQESKDGQADQADDGTARAERLAASLVSSLNKTPPLPKSRSPSARVR